VIGALHVEPSRKGRGRHTGSALTVAKCADEPIDLAERMCLILNPHRRAGRNRPRLNCGLAVHRLIHRGISLPSAVCGNRAAAIASKRFSAFGVRANDGYTFIGSPPGTQLRNAVDYAVPDRKLLVVRRSA
jgi:hypothetical protein